MGGLDGRVALVTGAGRGIGRAIAHRLSELGASVVVTDRDEAAAHEVARELGRWSVALGLDVTDREAVDRAVDRVSAGRGRLDVLVNNAGWDQRELFLDSVPETWDRIVAVNLNGVFNMSWKVLPLMAAQGGGRVLNLGSEAGRVGASGEAVYSATKGGVIAFTKAMAREMARVGVTVNCVCPGPTDTALFASVTGQRQREALHSATPLRRLGQPEDVAGMVAFLAGDEAAFITGQTISVSGGLTMM